MRQTDVLSPTFSTALKLFVEWVDGFETAVAPAPVRYPLYHYTKVRSFDGIFRNEELWLTSIFQQNDPSEVRYGTGILLQEIQGLLTEEKPPSVESKVIEFFCRQLTDVFQGRMLTDFEVFIGSLSRIGNDLDQWTRYGDDGRGICLGFGSEAIDAANAFIAPVNYGDRRAKQFHRCLVRRAVKAIADNMDFIRRDQMGSYNFLRLLSVELSKPLLTENVCTKDPSYNREKEVRLIVVKQAGDTAGVEEQPYPNGAGQRRFIRLKLPVQKPGSLKKVRIGPDAHPDMEAALERYLGHFGLKSSGLVERSKIPYRSSQPRTPLDQCLVVPD